jgi:hypothetical protein
MSGTAKQQQNLVNDNWIGLKAAAAYMHVNEKKLRLKDRNGFYQFWPQLTRIQPVAGGNIYLLRDELIAWREQQEEAAKQNKPPELRQDNTFESLREMFLANGWHQTLEKLGVKI